MSSATATALAPAYDFDKAVVALQASTDTNLGALLAELATIPDPKVKRGADLATVERVGENLMRNIAELPTVFNRVDPQKKRALNKTELVELLEEKERIDAVEKATKKRKERIHAILSDHFDCVAERKKVVTEQTLQDDKGHYLIATKGAPETQPVEGSGKYFTRERASDTTVFSYESLLALHEAGEISRADYLACTRPIRTREIDEDKLRRMLLSKKLRPRAQRLIRMISTVKRGRLSINLRGK
ncbi:hypothetical protein ABZS76_33335 [Streptomyces sp. NPDC005562]|uniref:hypothetical protein n=1 Tax=Streptomyces sp. NPDC005562 TaxID=3154890 RepID=UPI0033AE7D1F